MGTVNSSSNNNEEATTPEETQTKPTESPPPIDLSAPTQDPQDRVSETVTSQERRAPTFAGDNRQASSLTNTTGQTNEFDTPSETYARILRKGPPDYGPFPEFRYKCGTFVNHPTVSHIVTAIIIVNSLLMVISTFDFVLNNTPVKRVLNILDKVFLAIFSFESALQVTYYLQRIFRKAWLTFDLILVISSWALPEMTVFRALRILRIAARMKSIENVLTALIATIPKVGAIFALLMLIFYIFAVMFTTIFKEYPLCCPEDTAGEDLLDCPEICVEEVYFDRLDNTLFSLFQFLTMDFQGATRIYQKHVSWSPILFVLFVVVTGYIVFNLIVAVLCDALNVMGDKEEEEEDARQAGELKELTKQVLTLQKNQKMIQKAIFAILNEDIMDTTDGASEFSFSPATGISLLTRETSSGRISIRGDF